MFANTMYNINAGTLLGYKEGKKIRVFNRLQTLHIQIARICEVQVPVEDMHNKCARSRMIHALPPSMYSCSIPPCSAPFSHSHSQPAQSVTEVDKDLFTLDKLIRSPNTADRGGLPQT